MVSEYYTVYDCYLIGRKRYDCIIEGCDGKMLSKLSSHMMHKHKIADKSERLALCLLARQVYCICKEATFLS